LNWWKINVKEYPILSLIAQNLLSIPASSQPVESLFSKASDVITKKRSRLNPDLINNIMIIKANNN